MKTIFGLCVLGILAACYVVIAAAPRVHAVHVPGVGRVVWQDGSKNRWIVFPEERCMGFW